MEFRLAGKRKFHGGNHLFASTAREVRGPSQPWEHLDTFKEVEGGTRTVDGVRYKPRGGRLVNWLVVERDLHFIFVYFGR